MVFLNNPSYQCSLTQQHHNTTSSQFQVGFQSQRQAKSLEKTIEEIFNELEFPGMEDDFPPQVGAPKKEPTIDHKEEEEEEDDDDENNLENINEEHGLPAHISPAYNPTDYMSGYSTTSLKIDVKKNNTGKRQKPDDEEEDVKIESYIQRDAKSISVKDMRKLVPKLRIECFYTEQELSGKKKMKHLWDQKPVTWPENVPFKDPNNPGKEGSTKKPGKNDLVKMYNYLREVYLRNKGLPCSSFSPGAHSPVSHNPAQQQQHNYLYHQQQQEAPVYYHQQPQQQSHYQQQRGIPHHIAQQQFHGQMAYSPNNDIAKMAQPESMDEGEIKILALSNPIETIIYNEGQLIPSQVDPTVTGRMTDMSSTPPPPLTNGNSGQGERCLQGTMEKEEPFNTPQVVQDLHSRIMSKVEMVTRLPGVTDGVKDQLQQVIREVLERIYESLTNTSFCLMYLDAGHQMEALLDCMIVLGKVEANLLSSGCTEIKKKFQNFEVWYCHPYILKILSSPVSDFSDFDHQVKLRGSNFDLGDCMIRRIIDTCLDAHYKDSKDGYHDDDKKNLFTNMTEEMPESFNLNLTEDRVDQFGNAPGSLQSSCNMSSGVTDAALEDPFLSSSSTDANPCYPLLDIDNKENYDDILNLYDILESESGQMFQPQQDQQAVYQQQLMLTRCPIQLHREPSSPPKQCPEAITYAPNQGNYEQRQVNLRSSKIASKRDHFGNSTSSLPTSAAGGGGGGGGGGGSGDGGGSLQFTFSADVFSDNHSCWQSDTRLKIPVMVEKMDVDDLDNDTRSGKHKKKKK